MPAYVEARKRKLASHLEGFIFEVLMDDFNSDEYRSVAIQIDMFKDDGYKDPAEALCDYFDLGDGFASLLRECDFPFDDFTIKLDDEANQLDRDAQEVYEDMRHDYMSCVLPRGGLMG